MNIYIYLYRESIFVIFSSELSMNKRFRLLLRINKLRVEFVFFFLSKSSNYIRLESMRIDDILKLQRAITEITETSSRFKIFPLEECET